MNRRYYFILIFSYSIFSYFNLLTSDRSFIWNQSVDHIQLHAIVQFARVQEQVSIFLLIPKPGSTKVRTVSVRTVRKFSNFLVSGLFAVRAFRIKLFGLFGVQWTLTKTCVVGIDPIKATVLYQLELLLISKAIKA